MADWNDTTDVVEVVVKGAAEGQAILNVFHYVSPSTLIAPNTADLALFLAGFKTEWRNFVLPFMPNNYGVNSYNASVIVGRNPNPNPPPVPPGRWLPNLLRYGRQEVIAGLAGDVGALLGSRLTTFTAGSMRWVPSLRTAWSRTGSRLLVGLEDDTTTNKWAALPNNIPGAMATYATNHVAGCVMNAAGDKARPVAFGRTTFLRAGAPPNPWTFTSFITNGLFSQYVSSQVSRKQRDRFN